MLFCEDAHTANRRLILLVTTIVVAWWVCSSTVRAGEGLSARLAWNVPLVHFDLLHRPAEVSEFHPPESITTTSGLGDSHETCLLGAPREATHEMYDSSCEMAPVDRLPQVEPFDVRRFWRLGNGSFLAAQVDRPAEDFGTIVRVAFSEPKANPKRFRQPDPNYWSGATRRREPIMLALRRRRPLAPRGTMFIWSVAGAQPETASSFASAVRRNRGPSAGVVLTRPPGDYSLDWVGVAVTAPLH